MLTIVVPGPEEFDQETQKFITDEGFTLELEHSLVSLSKWESEFEKPFLGPGQRTAEELFEYIKCMILTPNVPPEVLARLTEENIRDISKYMETKRTATWFNETGDKKRSTEVITSELIYYWMIAATIPFECETWHLNRLFTLIRVYNAKNSKPQPMNRSDRLAQQRALNAQRKAKYNTSG